MAVALPCTDRKGHDEPLDIADCINDTCPWSGKPVAVIFSHIPTAERLGKQSLDSLLDYLGPRVSTSRTCAESLMHQVRWKTQPCRRNAEKLIHPTLKK